MNCCLGVYRTPQLKRRRIQDLTTISSPEPLKEQMDLLQNMLKEINKKLDQVNKKEDLVEKKLENFDKRLGGLLRQVNNKVRIIYPQLKYFRHFFQIVDL